MRDPQTARDAVVFELRCRGIRLHDVAIDAVLAVLFTGLCWWFGKIGRAHV